MGDRRDGTYDPSAPYDGAPPHLNGEERPIPTLFMTL
jgi:hypothetical protein